MSEETPAPRVVADRYVLRSVRGRGGMGTVWEAEDRLLERRVAVKEVLLRDRGALGDESTLRQRVLREARVAARVSHPNLVAIYDVVDGGDRVFLVQEYVDAPTLHDVVGSDGPLSPGTAAGLGRQVLGALVALHDAGVVHRDVKPSNVLVTPGGGVKVADFGIALMEGDQDLTLAGSVLGSPGYLAPEQASGRRAEPASDLWAFGATLWFAVEGRGPYGDSPGLAALGEVVHGPVPVAAGAGALAPVIEACLRKDPAARATPQALARLLDEAAAGPPAGPAPPTVAAPALTAPSPPVPVAPPPPAAPPPPPRPPPPAPAAPGPPLPPRRPPDRSAPRPWLLALGAAGVLVALVAAGLALAGGGDPAQTTSPTTTASIKGAAASTTVARGPTSTLAQSGSATPGPGGTPAGVSRHVDAEAGYSVAYPSGWQVRKLDATRTDLIDPATGTYLRVDWTKDPADPLEAWQRSSKAFGSSHQGYQEIRVAETEFQGFPGAIWEYRYDAGGGRLHASNLTFVTSEQRAYALNFQTADSRWDASDGLRDQLEGSFQVTAPAKKKGDDKDD